MAKFIYPEPRRDETAVDDYHGVKVGDPYKAFENPEAEETKQFVKEENKITNDYINSCEERDLIKKELTELWNYPKYGCPHREGDKYFFSKNTGLQNQSVMYVQDSLDSEAQVFLDANTLSEDGTVSISRASWSHDGSVLAYGLSESGSDWSTLQFKNVNTREDYPEVLEKLKFTTVSWTHDNKGVFYSCYPLHDPKNVSGKDTTSHDHQKLYYHVLGTSQDQDVLCVEFPDNPKWMQFSTVSDCGRFLLVSVSKDCKYNLCYYCDLQAQAPEGVKGKLTLTPFVPEQFDADYDYVSNIGTKVLITTNKNAKNNRLVQIDLENPDESAWVDIIKEDAKDVLRWVCMVAKDKLIACYMKDVKNTMAMYSLTGELLHDFNLDIGSVTGFSGDVRYDEILFKFSSQIAPGTIYHVDLTVSPPKRRVLIETEINNFKSDDFKVEQVFYPSKDGTNIPMFITMKKDFVPTGTDPCLLYAYGGFGHSLTPSFSITNTYFVQHFGIMAIANIRGGGEYGEAWTDSGRRENLQTCLTDFQCAAEYLIKEKFADKSKLTIYGGSHGGMLVGACTNQRPDLYGASVAAVGVMDMLKFHKHTIGYAWVSNYGCSDNKDEFQNLFNISPLHNVKVPENGCYPAMLLLTGDHDDRVVPSHTLKHIATLQHILGSLPQQVNPLLVRVDTKAGHGAFKPSSKSIEEYTDIFSFLIKSLNIVYRK